MRDFKIEGKWFYVNGRKTMLRGTVENCDFPLTGYAPMDVETLMYGSHFVLNVRVKARSGKGDLSLDVCSSDLGSFTCPSILYFSIYGLK